MISNLEERAAHEVTVAGFWIDRHEVINAEFVTLDRVSFELITLVIREPVP